MKPVYWKQSKAQSTDKRSKR